MRAEPLLRRARCPSQDRRSMLARTSAFLALAALANFAVPASAVAGNTWQGRSPLGYESSTTRSLANAENLSDSSQPSLPFGAARNPVTRDVVRGNFVREFCEVPKLLDPQRVVFLSDAVRIA